MDLFLPKTLLLLAAAFGYALATVGMKLSAHQLCPLGLALLVTGFIAATFAEVALMRGVSLGALYLTIIAVESLLVLAYAFVIGEGLSGAQIVGGGLVLAGVAVLAH